MDRGSLILGLETSCDETAAAVVADGRRVLGNVIATQHELHAKYQGVVPEIASRAHLQRLLPVIREAMATAAAGWDDLDAVAVGHRPGLIGSLLVGVSAAKAIAWSRGLPLLGVDHVIAHLAAGLLDAPPVEFPALGLVVSGGHTTLVALDDLLTVRPLGRTRDDAVGEAFDKAATMLELGYPGGPLVDRLAAEGDPDAVELPVSLLEPESLDFSFSGLKTALLYAVRGRPVGSGDAAYFPHDAGTLTRARRADLAASFQQAAVSAVERKLERAWERHPARTLLVGGGVSANSLLRRRLRAFAEARHLDLRLPRPDLCLDNAAMIAALGAARLAAGQRDDLTLSASPGSSLDAHG